MASETLDIMLDIETMALTPDALVLSIGAIQFASRSVDLDTRDTMLVVPNFMEQVMCGRRIDPETQKWWGDGERSRAAEHWLTPPAGAQMPVRSALAELALFVRSTSSGRIWANGAVFDIGILEHLYRSVNMAIPWKYNAVRDSRTIRQEIPPIPARDATDELTGETAHHPVSDCKVQIRDLWIRGF